jgi:hypothetical protein
MITRFFAETKCRERGNRMDRMKKKQDRQDGQDKEEMMNDE